MSEATDYRALILDVVDDIQISGDQQVTACLDFAERLKSTMLIEQEAFLTIQMVSIEVAELPSDVFLNTFVWNAEGVDEDSESKKQTWCFNLMNQLKYLKRIDEEVPVVLERYQEEISRLSDQWEFGIFKLGKSIKKKLKGEIDASTSLQGEIAKIWLAWERIGPKDDQNIPHMIEQLIEPMKGLIDKELLKNADDDFAAELAPLVQKLKDCQVAWEKCCIEYIDIFETLAPKMKQILTNLATTKASIADNTRPINNI